MKKPCSTCDEMPFAWWDLTPCHGVKKDGELCHRPERKPMEVPGKGLVFFKRCTIHANQEKAPEQGGEGER